MVFVSNLGVGSAIFGNLFYKSDEPKKYLQ